MDLVFEQSLPRWLKWSLVEYFHGKKKLDDPARLNSNENG
jgi:hypothetical protein